MVYEFKFPDVGDGITEGELIEWKVNVGDKVKEDQVLVDVETDKALVQIPSPVAGTILKINYAKGETVKVGAIMLLIGADGENIEPKKKEKLEEKINTGKTEEQPKKSYGVVGELEDADEIDKKVKEARTEINKIESKKEESAVEQAEKVIERVLAMPRVKSLAKELGVTIKEVSPTGRSGQVTESDVRTKKGAGVSEVKKEITHVRKYDMYGYVTRESLKGVRKAIARNMMQSASEIPQVSHVDLVDMTALTKIRDAEKKDAEKKGIKLTYLPFIIKAVIAALKEHPSLNASLEIDEEGNQEIVMKKYYDIGIAVDTPEGLIVPVIKGVNSKNVLDIAKEITSLAEKARNREINLGDLNGGTFTITNYGSIGGLYGTPMINYPEAAILGLGRMKEDAVVINGKIEIRKTMHLSLTFDHRILDGAEAARFMNKLMGFIENPDSLLLEI